MRYFCIAPTEKLSFLALVRFEWVTKVFLCKFEKKNSTKEDTMEKLFQKALRLDSPYPRCTSAV